MTGTPFAAAHALTRRATRTAPVQPPPPRPEPARVMAQREIRVQHDPVYAAIAARQQVPVAFGEVIGHPSTVRPRGASRQPDCPRRGPLLLGEVPDGA